MDLKNSLKQSCDVYYYDVAMKVGINKITEMANRLAEEIARLSTGEIEEISKILKQRNRRGGK